MQRSGRNAANSREHELEDGHEHDLSSSCNGPNFKQSCQVRSFVGQFVYYPSASLLLSRTHQSSGSPISTTTSDAVQVCHLHSSDLNNRHPIVTQTINSTQGIRSKWSWIIKCPFRMKSTARYGAVWFRGGHDMQVSPSACLIKEFETIQI